MASVQLLVLLGEEMAHEREALINMYKGGVATEHVWSTSDLN